MTARGKVQPRPSACVIPLRDGGAGLEILMVRRSPKASVFAGAWTFPGGQIDADDYGDAARDEMAAARRAAAREALEEARLRVDPGDLMFISRWTTPDYFPRRFRTWFFLWEADSRPVRVDGAEIVDHCWLTPAAALERQQAGGMDLPPPIFILTVHLSTHPDKAAAISHFAAAAPIIHTPRVVKIKGGFCFLYPADAGYEARDPEAPGPHHRLWAMQSGWRYVPLTDSQSPRPCR